MNLREFLQIPFWRFKRVDQVLLALYCNKNESAFHVKFM